MLRGCSMLRVWHAKGKQRAKGVYLEFGERELAVAVDVARSEERSRLAYKVAA